jgi:hypothetical protein
MTGSRTAVQSVPKCVPKLTAAVSGGRKCLILKCARHDSNVQPSDPKSDALSIELRARGLKPVAS